VRRGSGLQPVVAVGGVAVKDDALLLVRRRNPPEAGRWTIPGGRVEVGESLAQAVERELREETALEVSCRALRGFAERILPDHHYVILDFDVVVVGDREPVAGGDASAVSWVPLAEVPEMDTVSGLVGFLQENGVIG
jgi:8-oxo-dGTP diphosphatase